MIKFKDPECLSIYLEAGKKDKINKMDRVGFFMKEGEQRKDELGKLEVLDRAFFVAVKRKMSEKLLRMLKTSVL